MTARLSATIMAHPDRSGFVTELRSALDRDVPVVWDEKGDRWDTGSRALLAYDPEATHHLVLQDDAVVCRDLLAGVERACDYLGTQAAMCLYFGRVKRSRRNVWRLIHRTRADTSWIVTPQLNWGVGVVLPTWLLDGLVKSAHGYTDLANYDRRIGRYLQAQHIPVYYPWPSLIDHRDSPSLVPGRWGRKRHAYTFVGTEASALDQRLEGRTVRAPQAVGIRSQRTRLGS